MIGDSELIDRILRRRLFFSHGAVGVLRDGDIEPFVLRDKYYISWSCIDLRDIEVVYLIGGLEPAAASTRDLASRLPPDTFTSYSAFRFTLTEAAAAPYRRSECLDKFVIEPRGASYAVTMLRFASRPLPLERACDIRRTLRGAVRHGVEHVYVEKEGDGHVVYLDAFPLYDRELLLYLFRRRPIPPMPPSPPPPLSWTDDVVLTDEEPLHAENTL